MTIAAAVGVALAPAGCSSPRGENENVGETSEAYTQDCPDAGTVEGIDVYDGQGTIDWNKVKAGKPDAGGGGKDFAFIKATQGNYNQQTKFDSNWTNAKTAGVLRSAYHFFDPTIDGKEQAAYFLAEVGADLGELPPLVDIECPTDAVEANASANCEYTGNSGWAPPATIQSRLFDFLDAVETATGKKALIYSYPSWFGDIGVTDPKLANYPLYIASLNTCASVPAPWTSAVFWQYSFTGTVYGISGQCDLDRFIGDLSSLDDFAFGIPDAGVDASRPILDAGNFADTGSEPAIEVTAQADADAGCACNAVGSGSSDAPKTGIFAIAAMLAAALR
ncbi:MAG: glycoside hydrolase family 25 protein, partial [Polyangiaceae bacterium]